MPTAEILSQGDEVVTGQVADTNAAWLSDRLTGMGFTVVRHTSVGDRLADIVAQLQESASRGASTPHLVLSTGGLGPTEDDLTARAVAQAFERPLVLDTQALEHIKQLYARFSRHMPAVNEKQAWLPTGCRRLDNHWGTAPGFAVQQGGAWLVFFPGVPREMRKMFDAWALPLIDEAFHLQPGRLVTLRTTGVGESNLQERLDKGTGALDAGVAAGHVVVSFRTRLPENHIKLRFAADVGDNTLREVVSDVVDRVGSPVFAIHGLDDRPENTSELAAVVGQALLSADATVACAESCTGGRVASMFTAIPGSSAWFLEGAVTYTNAAKVRMLGVDDGLIQAHGAVSEPVARAMAEGVRERAGATYGLSTTGIAGPTGGSDDKPVGTVHIALATPEGTQHRRLSLAGDRERIQTLSAAAVIDLLRRHLQPSLGL